MTTTTCLTEDCGDQVIAKGLCGACYAWDRYHMKRGHGIRYMLTAQRRNKRIAARIGARLGARRRLRAVAGRRR